MKATLSNFLKCTHTNALAIHLEVAPTFEVVDLACHTSPTFSHLGSMKVETTTSHGSNSDREGFCA